VLKNEQVDEPILNLQPTIDQTIGFPCKFGASSWFKIAILEVPPHEKLPTSITNTEEIGIILNRHRPNLIMRCLKPL
jgi:hypothetical protein